MCPAQWFEWERVIIGSSSHCCGLSCVTPHPPWAPSQAGSTSLKWEPPTTLRAGTQANNLPRSKLSSWPRDSSASNSTFRPCCAAVGQGQLFRLVGAPLLFINKWRFKHWDSIEQRGQNKAAYRKVFIGQRAKFLEHHLTLPRGNTVASGCPMDMHLPSRTFSLQQAQRTSWGLTQMLWKKRGPLGHSSSFFQCEMFALHSPPGPSWDGDRCSSGDIPTAGSSALWEKADLAP